MRADMFKVIVERPRWGASHAPPVKLRLDKNRDRKFVGHKRHASEVAAYTKSLNENLAPLRRFLQKQRGRLWNDVFSEICSGLDTGSTVKMHVREHIEDYVMVHISIDQNGGWLGCGKWRQPMPPSWHWPEFYVDPHDGILKETRLLCQTLGVEWKRRYIRVTTDDEGPFDDFLWLSNCQVLLKRMGCWFVFELNFKPKSGDAQVRKDLLSGDWRQLDQWTVVSHKQLSKKELKLHKLVNGRTRWNDEQ